MSMYVKHNKTWNSTDTRGKKMLENYTERPNAFSYLQCWIISVTKSNKKIHKQ